MEKNNFEIMGIVSVIAIIGLVAIFLGYPAQRPNITGKAIDISGGNGSAWALEENGVYVSNENVGIGTPNPTGALHILNTDNDPYSGVATTKFILESQAQNSIPIEMCGEYAFNKGCGTIAYDVDNEFFWVSKGARFAGDVRATTIFTAYVRATNISAVDVCTTAGKCLSASGSGSCNCPWKQSQNETGGNISEIIYTNGNVGIGTQSPYAKLQIDAKNSETGLSAQTTGNGLGIYAYSNYTAIRGYGLKGNGINAISYSGTAVVASSSYGFGVSATSYNQTAGYFSSTTGYGLIVANGNTGIGITTPTEKLDVNGNVKIRALNGTGQAYACLDSAGKLYRSATPCV